MKFTKMEGCGNDYVYVNGFDTKIEDPNKLSEIVSNRHFGIGSDGLIVINPSDVADFKMSMYNADGKRKAVSDYHEHSKKDAEKQPDIEERIRCNWYKNAGKIPANFGYIICRHWLAITGVQSDI